MIDYIVQVWKIFEDGNQYTITGINSFLQSNAGYDLVKSHQHILLSETVHVLYQFGYIIKYADRKESYARNMKHTLTHDVAMMMKIELHERLLPCQLIPTKHRENMDKYINTKIQNKVIQLDEILTNDKPFDYHNYVWESLLNCWVSHGWLYRHGPQSYGRKPRSQCVVL